jgi:hypothetical protein
VKGDLIPWVVQVVGKRAGGLELGVGKLIIERGKLANLRDHRLLWIHSPNSGVMLKYCNCKEYSIYY